MSATKLWLVVAGIVFTQSALALSLGDISTFSRLGEPLRARIDIPSFQPAELDGLDIQLADRNVFQSKGVEWGANHDSLRFRVETESKDKAYIVVESSKPVNDLDFSFLIKVSSNGSGFIRRYDVLVGMPIEETKAVLDPGSEQNTNQNTVVADAIASITTPSPIIRSEANAAGMIEYGPVKRGEVLSIIAQKMRGHRTASLQQMMMSIFQQNPESFLNQNINELVKGSMLRIKEFDTLQDVNKRKANQFVVAQIEEWEKRRGDLSNMVAQVASSVLTIEEVSEKDLTANKNPVIDQASGSTDQQNDVKPNDLAILRKELQETDTESSALQQQNQELSAKIAELEKQMQNGTMQLFNGQAAQSIITRENSLFADDIAVANNDYVVIDEGGADYSAILGVILVSLGIVVLVYLMAQHQRGNAPAQSDFRLQPVRAGIPGWLRWFGPRHAKMTMKK